MNVNKTKERIALALVVVSIAARWLILPGLELPGDLAHIAENALSGAVRRRPGGVPHKRPASGYLAEGRLQNPAGDGGGPAGRAQPAHGGKGGRLWL